jgi:hypothetical protein
VDTFQSFVRTRVVGDSICIVRRTIDLLVCDMQTAMICDRFRRSHKKDDDAGDDVEGLQGSGVSRTLIGPN